MKKIILSILVLILLQLLQLLQKNNHSLTEKTLPAGKYMELKSGLLKMDYWFAKAVRIKNMGILRLKSFTRTLT